MSHSNILKIILITVILITVFWGSKTIENYFQDIIGYITNYMNNGKWTGMAIFGALAVISVMLVSFFRRPLPLVR